MEEIEKKENRQTSFRLHLFQLREQPLHQWLFILLLFLLPTQLGRHFWFDFSIVRGIRIDYLSPTVYLTDVITLLIILSCGFSEFEKVTRFLKRNIVRVQDLPKTSSEVARMDPDGSRREQILLNRKRLRNIFWIASSVLFIILNSILSSEPIFVLYKWGKFIEIGLLGYYVSKYFSLIQKHMFWPFSLSVVYTSLLAWLQVFNQSSLGGFAWLLGERTFTASTPGIAKMVIDGSLFLRPYATFSHPNALAGYLLVVITFLFFTAGTKKSLWKRILLVFAVSMGVSTILLAFSKAVWFVGMVTVLLWVKAVKNKRFKHLITSITGVSIIILVLFFAANPFTESIRVRYTLSVASLRIIMHSPIWGVGLGLFVKELPGVLKESARASLLQPVHNIYLLIAAEMGIIGLFVFSWMVYRVFYDSTIRFMTKRILSREKRLWKWYELLLIQILLLGLFDHYFFTLQQTFLLFVIVVGVVYSSVKEKSAKLKEISQKSD